MKNKIHQNNSCSCFGLISKGQEQGKFDNSLHPRDLPKQITSVFDNLWTVTDTAEYLRVPKATVYDWVHRKAIPFYKVNRLLRFKPKEIEKWLNSEKE